MVHVPVVWHQEMRDTGSTQEEVSRFDAETHGRFWLTGEVEGFSIKNGHHHAQFKEADPC